MDPSPEELKDRIENLGAEHDHGDAEGAPDPQTAENTPEAAGTQKEGFVGGKNTPAT